jgi:hypothetical protein
MQSSKMKESSNFNAHGGTGYVALVYVVARLWCVASSFHCFQDILIALRFN